MQAREEGGRVEIGGKEGSAGKRLGVGEVVVARVRGIRAAELENILAGCQDT